MRKIEDTLLYKWFHEVWNKKNVAAIAQLMTNDAEFQGIDDTLPKGAAGFQAFYKIFTAQFHDIRIEVEDVIAQDNMEAARTIIYATHAATQKPVVVPGLCMIRIESEKIAQAWNSYDFASVAEQVADK